MFTYFIYYIIVILVYATYQAPAKTPPDLHYSIYYFLITTALYLVLVRAAFSWLGRQLVKMDPPRIDHYYNMLISRFSVTAILFLAIQIHIFDFPLILRWLPLFSAFPTLEAVFFLVVYIFYLSSMWWMAHDVYQEIYGEDISKKNYVFSNISISLPVIFPWLIMSFFMDCIQMLPFAGVKQFMQSPFGEVSYFLVFLLLVATIGPVMIWKFWRCKPLEPGFYRSRIEALCNRAGLEFAEILHWPVFSGRMITASVMGFVKRFRYILVTDGLLAYLEPDEVDAVVAHEIGHVKKRHMYLYLVFFAGYMVIAFGAVEPFFIFLLYAEAAYGFTGFLHPDPSSVLPVITSVFVIVLFLLYFRYIFGYFMRNFERQADCYVYALFPSADPLIRTFQKIAATSGEPPDKPNWHHFSISERLMYLKKCEINRNWITHQNKKIRISLGIYLLGLLTITGTGYQLHYGSVGEKMTNHFLHRILENDIKENPNNPNSYMMLGDICYKRGELEKAIYAYRKGIQLSEEPHPELLNNLAWALATAKQEELRKPGEAIILAEKAAKLSAKPHILDTLAESYFANGDYSQAVKTGEKAYQLAAESTWNKEMVDISYYRSQLEKFQNALSSQGNPD